MHDFEPYRTIDPSFVTAPGYNFIINGAVAPRDAAQVNVGLKYGLTKNAALFTNFNGEFSGQGNGYAGMIGFDYTW